MRATHQIEISLKRAELGRLEIRREYLLRKHSHIGNTKCPTTSRPRDTSAPTETVGFHIEHFEKFARELLWHATLPGSRVVALIGYLLLHHCHTMFYVYGMDSDVYYGRLC